MCPTTEKGPKTLPKLATQPIAWSNDDFKDLGGETTIDKCLTEMREAGFAGTEKGHKFPNTTAELKTLLEKFNLSLASAWHSTYLLENPLEEETNKWLQHVRLLKSVGCQVAIAAECSDRVYDQGKLSLRGPEAKMSLNNSQWEKLTKGLDHLAEAAEKEGLKLAYHYHMGTIVQTQQEVEELMKRTKKIGLVFDTGHAAFAGIDPMALLKKYNDRIFHVHLKNIRPDIVKAARKDKWSFEKAVRAGVFTVPGDGGLDFETILNYLKTNNNSKWWVVEAEQDPKVANPFEYAQKAREYIRQTVGV